MSTDVLFGKTKDLKIIGRGHDAVIVSFLHFQCLFGTEYLGFLTVILLELMR